MMREIPSSASGIILPTSSAATISYVRRFARSRLAVSRIRGLARHLFHSSHVDADRGQDPNDAHALDQPLVARHALFDRAGPHHQPNPVWDRRVRDSFRFYLT